MKQQWKNHKPLLAALATLAVLLAGVVLIWLAQVRPNVGKGRSEIITDFLRAELIHDGETAEQVFTYDKDILTIGLEFYLPGAQPHTRARCRSSPGCPPCGPAPARRRP